MVAYCFKHVKKMLVYFADFRQVKKNNRYFFLTRFSIIDYIASKIRWLLLTFLLFFVNST